MPRAVLGSPVCSMVRVVSVLSWCLLLGPFWIVAVSSDCWFQNDRHAEGSEVATQEPCLNCSCRFGALVCYLRVCPKLPDPPPMGCIIVHRRKNCCAELICKNPTFHKRIIAPRLDEEDEDGSLLINRRNFDNTKCVENGTIYGAGSAMDSSSRCNHCFCIEGRRTCITPKCLLSLDGCSPIFDMSSCCPVRYNCTNNSSITNIVSTTTTNPPPTTINLLQLPSPENLKGCMVSGKFYPDGIKVLGAGHSICDNCYCLRGILRCEPQSCAPPILGCTPIIKHGACCASSYNCNGTIEIDAEPYYAQLPTISKEYAKLRKEVVQKHTKIHKTQDSFTANQSNDTTVYVMAESSPGTYTRYPSTGTTRRIYHASTKQPTAELENRQRTTNQIIDTRSRPSSRTTATSTTPKQVRSSDYDEERLDDEDDFLSIVDSFFGSNLQNRSTSEKVQNSKPTTPGYYHSVDTEVTTQVIKRHDNITDDPVPNLTDVLSNLFSSFAESGVFETTSEDENLNYTTDLPISTTQEAEKNTTTGISTTQFGKTMAPLTILTTLVTTTDCIQSNASTDPSVTLDRKDNAVEDEKEISNDIVTTTTHVTSTDAEVIDSTTATPITQREVTVIDLELKVKVETLPHQQSSNNKTTSEIEAILKTMKDKNKDYENYDYDEPTLPPSLPNLKIIPFVAADALDSKKEDVEENSIYSYPINMRTEAPVYNLFSPPTKTEGGFVPKEPPLLPPGFYNYHTTKIVDITSANPLPLGDFIITPSEETRKNGCLVENREYQHSETVTEKDCVICVCFDGNVICHGAECPKPSSNCKEIEPNTTSSSCCPQYVCDELNHHDSMPIDRLDITPGPLIDIITVQNSVISHGDHFGSDDRTRRPLEPDNIDSTERTKTTSSDGFDFNKVWSYLLYGETTPFTTPSSVTTENVASTSTGVLSDLQTHNVSNGLDSAAGVGLLKLAGCNIYGRMYRVGRIISELSGPCLECRCTEVGVQCKPLTC